MIPSTVLKSALWRSSESGRALSNFPKLQNFKFQISLVFVKTVCPISGEDIHRMTIPSIVLESVVWRRPETARAFCDFQKNLISQMAFLAHFCPKICFFSTLRPYNPLFWPQRHLTQWDYIFPMSSGNSGYIRFSCRCPLGRSAGRFLAPIAQNGPFGG